jgi:hypothetical protein
MDTMATRTLTPLRDPVRDLQSVFAGHLHVQHEYRRPEPIHQIDRFRTFPFLVDHVEIAPGFQHRAEACRKMWWSSAGTTVT